MGLSIPRLGPFRSRRNEHRNGTAHERAGSTLRSPPLKPKASGFD
jgi:hypothetical protein